MVFIIRSSDITSKDAFDVQKRFWRLRQIIVGMGASQTCAKDLASVALSKNGCCL